MPFFRLELRPAHLIFIPACFALAACESSGSYRVGSVGSGGATGAVGPVLWSYIITQGQGYGVF